MDIVICFGWIEEVIEIVNKVFWLEFNYLGVKVVKVCVVF